MSTPEEQSDLYLPSDTALPTPPSLLGRPNPNTGTLIPESTAEFRQLLRNAKLDPRVHTVDHLKQVLQTKLTDVQPLRSLGNPVHDLELKRIQGVLRLLQDPGWLERESVVWRELSQAGRERLQTRIRHICGDSGHLTHEQYKTLLTEPVSEVDEAGPIIDETISRLGIHVVEGPIAEILPLNPHEAGTIARACCDTNLISLYQAIETPADSPQDVIKAKLKHCRDQHRQMSDSGNSTYQVRSRLLELSGQFLGSRDKRASYDATLQDSATRLIHEQLDKKRVLGKPSPAEAQRDVWELARWLPITAACVAASIAEYCQKHGWPYAQTPAVGESRIYCPGCEVATSGADQCDKCGWPRRITCPKCGSLESTSRRFCAECEFAIADLPAAEELLRTAQTLRDSDPAAALEQLDLSLHKNPHSSAGQSLHQSVRLTLEARNALANAQFLLETNPQGAASALAAIPAETAVTLPIQRAIRDLQEQIEARLSGQRRVWLDRFRQTLAGELLEAERLLQQPSGWESDDSLMQEARSLLADERIRRRVGAITTELARMTAAFQIPDLGLAERALDALDLLGPHSAADALRIRDGREQLSARQAQVHVESLIRQRRILAAERSLATVSVTAAESLRAAIASSREAGRRWRVRAQRARKTGDFPEAIRCLDEALSHVADDPDLIQLRGTCVSAIDDRRRLLKRALSSEQRSPVTRRTLGILLLTAVATLLGLYGLFLRPSQQANRRHRELDAIAERVAQGKEVWADEPWKTVAEPDQALTELSQRLLRAGRRHLSEGQRLQGLGDPKSHQEAVEQLIFSANTHRFLAEKNTDPHRVFQGECLYMAGVAARSIPDPRWARALLLDAIGAFQVAAKQLENQNRQQAAEECRERASMCQQELDSLASSLTPP